jgi:hypothetical protein
MAKRRFTLQQACNRHLLRQVMSVVTQTGDQRHLLESDGPSRAVRWCVRDEWGALTDARDQATVGAYPTSVQGRQQGVHHFIRLLMTSLLQACSSVEGACNLNSNRHPAIFALMKILRLLPVTGYNSYTRHELQVGGCSLGNS